MTKISNLIKIILNEIGYIPNEDYEEYPEHFLLYNPFTKDNNSKSSVIYKSTGNLKMYDSVIKIKRKGVETEDSVLTLSEWTRKLNQFSHYIFYILKKEHIKISDYMDYQESIKHFMFFNTFGECLTNRQIKKIKEIRTKLFNNYILDYDVIGCNETNLQKAEKCPIPQCKVKETNTLFLEPLALESLIIDKYIQQRKIPEHKNVKKIIVGYNGGKYRFKSICFIYPSGFRKFRIIDGNNRYLSNKDIGRYENFFEARVKNTKKCYVVEGEIESLSILDATADDVYGMHNTNSLPSSLSQLQNYEEIIFKIDLDSYGKVKNKIYNAVACTFPKKMVRVEYKINNKDKTIDYNKLLTNKEEIIL